jgi:uncharacterized protein (DUF2384 family)
LNSLTSAELMLTVMEVVSLAYGVFEQPESTEAWLKTPHPLLHQVSPLQHCRTAIGAGQVRRLLAHKAQCTPI